MGFPSFPPSGKVVSLMEVLALKGLIVAFGYVSSDTVRRERKRGRTLVGRGGESLFRVS